MRCKLQSKCLLYVFVCCFSRNSIERGELLNKPVKLPRSHVTPYLVLAGHWYPLDDRKHLNSSLSSTFLSNKCQVSCTILPPRGQHQTQLISTAPDLGHVTGTESRGTPEHVTLLPVVVLRSGVWGVPSERNCIRSPYVKQHVLLYQVLGVRATEFA